MAHEITSTDNMFSYNEIPWHGLGQVLDHYPTMDEAYETAFGWEPVEETIFRRVPIVTAEGELIEEFQEYTGDKLIVRSDNAEVLGAVSEGFTAVSNREMFDIAEALESDNHKGNPVKLETGGSLFGGKKVWLLVRLEDPIPVKGDPRGDTIPYFTLQNSHDGTGAFKGSACFTRIVCNNTLQWANMEARDRGTEFSFKHTKSIDARIAEAKEALSMWKVNIYHWQEMMEHLNSVRVTKEQRDDFIDLFIPEPMGAVISDRTRNNIASARDDMRGLFESPTLDYIELTAGGLLQGAIEWQQHLRRTNGSKKDPENSDRIKAENKFARAFLKRDELTRTALSLVKELVAV